MSEALAREARRVLDSAELLHAPAAVELAYDRMAQAIADTLAEANPLVLSVMVGGMIPTASLLRRFNFSLELDYVHATRYRGDTRGADLHWRAEPATALTGRSVLVVDDILDEGITLAAILDYCHQRGAGRVYSAVLVEKEHDRKPVIEHADFTGLTVDDRYVFGCGMDYKSYLRSLSGIYAVREG